MSSIAQHVPLIRTAALPAAPIWMLLGALLVAAAVLIAPLAEVTAFAGPAHVQAFLSKPGLRTAIANSLTIALACTLITVPIAFVYAYALHRSRMPARHAFRVIAQLPLLCPSLLPAIGLVYLFGHQGMLRAWLPFESVYGPFGIIAGLSFWCFPHAVLIIGAALDLADRRLHEAAASLGANKLRILLQVTLPAAKYGLISAALVVFTLSLADFGVPKVLGGRYEMLATEVYAQMIGRNDFAMAAVAALALLLPSLAAFAIAGWIRRRQTAFFSAGAEPLQITPHRMRDAGLFAFCVLTCMLLGAIVLAALGAAFIQLWPYDLTPTLVHFSDDAIAGGWRAFGNSLQLASWCALLGPLLMLGSAYLTQRTRRAPLLRGVLHVLAVAPMAVPGLVLGLGYVLFFNSPDNPLNGLYGTMAILVIGMLVHHYGVGHLALTGVLTQLDERFEQVAATLNVSQSKLLVRVILPLCAPALLEVAVYLFVNALTSVSAVIFLYGPSTTLASIAVIDLSDAGKTAEAAAMATLVFAAALCARVLHAALASPMQRRIARWRTPSTHLENTAAS